MEMTRLDNDVRFGPACGPSVICLLCEVANVWWWTVLEVESHRVSVPGIEPPLSPWVLGICVC